MKQDLMNILVLEDNEIDTHKVENLLSTSRRGSENRHVIRTIKSTEIDSAKPVENPDIIIFDIHEKKAEEKIIKASKTYKNSAIIVISSSSKYMLEKDAFRIGVQDFLDKNDVDTGSLWKSVNYAITKKRMEIAMNSDRENLDKANSILQVTSEISSRILDGQTHMEDMISVIGTRLGIDGLAVFCGKCLCDEKPYCCWTGGKLKESTSLEESCIGEDPLPEGIARFIKNNVPLFSMITNVPSEIKSTVSWGDFKGDSKVMIVPIMMDHEPWGMFCFYSINGKTWSVAEMDALATLSRLGGSIIRNKQIEDEMVAEVQESFSEINRLINRGKA